MKTAYIFPGQGSQFCGMGAKIYNENEGVRKYFHLADEILGFELSNIMFNGSDEDLRQTRVTQPAVFLHSLAAFYSYQNKAMDMVAGHSLGEFSALVACGVLNFEDGLKLVSLRAGAMQRATEKTKGGMAAVIGMDIDKIEEICSSTPGTVIVANYNNDSQTVISGEIEALDRAVESLKENGAKRVIPLAVGGAFHSPLMESARNELAAAIEKTSFSTPVCPIYQNVTALATSDYGTIKENLLLQLTSSVRWTQSVKNMLCDGATTFIEFGPGKVLQGLVKRIATQEVTLLGIE